MVFGLLALEVPAERRSATLNLVYLPLYAAGIIGPAVGAALASVGGVAGPFIAGGTVFLLGAATVYARVGATTRGARVTAEPDRGRPRPPAPDRTPIPGGAAGR